MKNSKKNIIFLFFLIFASCNCFAKTNIKHISFDKDHNIIIDIDDKTDFKTYSLKNPERLVIDIDDAEIEDAALEHDFPEYVSAVRKGKKEDILRVVFDLEKQIYIKKTAFKKAKNEEFGHIIINTSFDPLDSSTKNITLGKTEKNNQKVVTKYELQPWAQMLEDRNQAVTNNTKIEKIPIIVIDAGHGGKDPGTIGDYARTKEKNITLSYARELAKHLANTKNYKVYLTRDSDEFIPLKERVEIARKQKADLFISLHADSASDRSTTGLSVYTLSEKSSDKQAELLAQKENRSDIIAGINFANTSGDILKTLIDLSQRSTMNSSSKFANEIIKSMRGHDIAILQNTHRFAGFMVLTAPDMTSVLIELGYLSNRDEESDLNSLGHKRNIIKALVDAIDQYFKIKK